MDDYCSTSFMEAFTRFSCKNEFTKKLLTDERSQLKKRMVINEARYSRHQNKTSVKRKC